MRSDAASEPESPGPSPPPPPPPRLAEARRERRMVDRRRAWALGAAVLALALQGLGDLPPTRAAQLRPSRGSPSEEPADSPGWYEHELSVQCTQEEMLVSVRPREGGAPSELEAAPGLEGFSGAVYPRGLGRAPACLSRYRRAAAPLLYRLPLRACNTMPHTLDDGTTEYRNVLMVQPHPRLVTGRGKAHPVACAPGAAPPAPPAPPAPRTARLQDVSAHDSLSVSTISSDKLPLYSMKIYKGDPVKKEVATNVKIGDPLTLLISLDSTVHRHGMKVTDCTVRDGLGWAQQNLVNDDGCPLDNEIMGTFAYSDDGASAAVSFQAHKFPYTPSVYYHCIVKICSSTNQHECEPTCGKNRVRRQTLREEEVEAPAKIEVFSGLYVNEATDLPPDTDFVTKEKNPEDAICISQRNFAIAICIAGLILMLAVVAAILVILARRRGPKSVSNTGSSIYSGPYTNTGYSHTS